MKSKKEKPPFHALAGDEKGSYNHFKSRANHSNTLKRNIINSAPEWAKNSDTNLLRDITDCNKWIKFRHFPRFKDLAPENKVKQCSFHCRRDKLCSFCAIRKSQKVFHQIQDKVDHLGLKKDDLFLVTISPRNEEDLRTGIDVNRDFVKKLFQGGRDAKRKKSSKIENTPWFAVDGWIGKLETTHNEKIKESWHPHYHFLVAPKATHKELFYSTRIPHSYGSENGYFTSKFAQLLGDLLYKFTKGNSYVVHTEEVNDMGKGIAEVSKYLFKFSSMPAEKTWEVAEVTSKMRLATTGGIFRGLKLEPELMDDEIDLNDNSRPWIDFMLSWDGLTLREAVEDSEGLEKLEKKVRDTIITDTERIEKLKSEGNNHFFKVRYRGVQGYEITGGRFVDDSINHFAMMQAIEDVLYDELYSIEPLFQNHEEEEKYREEKEDYRRRVNEGRRLESA